ncbi:MAG: hypothetical protein AABX70_01820 [Nanoarchaeota archaeon]
MTKSDFDPGATRVPLAHELGGDLHDLGELVGGTVVGPEVDVHATYIMPSDVFATQLALLPVSPTSPALAAPIVMASIDQAQPVTEKLPTFLPLTGQDGITHQYPVLSCFSQKPGQSAVYLVKDQKSPTGESVLKTWLDPRFLNDTYDSSPARRIIPKLPFVQDQIAFLRATSLRPGIITAHEWERTDQAYKVLFQYFPPETHPVLQNVLNQRLKDRKPFDEISIARMVYTLAETLNDVKKLGFLFRDLKPANVVLSKESKKPIVFDFDLIGRFKGAVSGPPESFFGSIAYAPLEALLVQDDLQSSEGKRKFQPIANQLETNGTYDVYSLFALGYTLAKLKTPFGPTPADKEAAKAAAKTTIQGIIKRSPGLQKQPATLAALYEFYTINALRQGMIPKVYQGRLDYSHVPLKLAKLFDGMRAPPKRRMTLDRVMDYLCDQYRIS